MPIPASLKKRWHTLGNTRQILAATQNLTISPFDRTEDGLLDFRGIILESWLDKNYAGAYGRSVARHRADFMG